MPSRHRPLCHLMSYDYQDQDVIINCRLFYSAAGFRARVNPRDEACELLVVLRGDPGERHRGYRGRVHVYDYEKGRVVDWRQRFPAAAEIVLISPIRPEANDGLPFIEAYVPVMARFWQLGTTLERQQRLLHLANYKFVSGDPFHNQLIALIRSGWVEVVGSNWQHVGIQARPLSYWAANRRLARSRWCIGLMYPNQRGRSLSGRMWQAPLQGCHVISEAGTNLLNCPGVVEVAEYTRGSIQAVALPPAEELREQATQFWHDRTQRLARQLGLSLARPSPRELLRCHRQLIAGELQQQAIEWRGRIPGPRQLGAGLRRRWRRDPPSGS